MVTGDHPLTAEAIAKQVIGALCLRYCVGFALTNAHICLGWHHSGRDSQ
jgi:magnesium-transporting ATPase (P-type)